MKWEQSPAWATHKLTLEGGTSIWSTEAVPSVMLGPGENMQKIEVVAVEKRPEYKTHKEIKSEQTSCLEQIWNSMFIRERLGWEHEVT